MYFPKSQIKSNLYTNGEEYILSTSKESYTGYYYTTSNGSSYTGRNPQDGPNILLLNSNKIKYGDKRYNSPSKFSSDHYHILRKDRDSNLNGWKECEYKVGDDWISIYSLKKLN